MGKTVFVLGAGASAKAGGPLMNDFLDRARDLLSAGKVANNNADFEKVFKALVKLREVYYKSGLDLDNIESVFGAFEMARIIGKLGDYTQEQIEDLVISIRVLIVRTLEQCIKYPCPGEFVHPPVPYGKFVRLLIDINKLNKPADYCSVLTFNYDVALDYAFAYSGQKPDYCLETPPQEQRIKLLKLHGSLNWGKCPKCGKITGAYLTKVAASQQASRHVVNRTATLPFAQHLVTEECNDPSCKTHLLSEPAIVPPTWNKTEYQTELTNVWKQAAVELGQAENIICIGYSLPESDLFFRYLFALGTVGEAHLRRFWAFDPDRYHVIENRFVRLIGQGIERRFKFMDGDNGIFGAAINRVRQEFIESAS